MAEAQQYLDDQVDDDPFSYPPVADQPDPQKAEADAQLAAEDAADTSYPGGTDGTDGTESPAANTANAAADFDWQKWPTVGASPEIPATTAPESSPVDVPPGHIDLAPPDVKTDPDTGTRYVIDKEGGQMVPYAERATAADKLAAPPEGQRLSEVKVEATPRVERADLVDPDPDLLYTSGIKETDVPPEVRRGALVGAEAPRARAVPIPAGPVTPAQPVPIPAGPVTPEKPAPIPAGPVETRVQSGTSLEGTDPRLTEIITAAAQALPPGYTVRPTSGMRSAGQGQHTLGKATDWQIFGPDGEPVRNRGDDDSGLYTVLAQNAYGYQEKYHPDLTGQFQWGGQFGTSSRNLEEPDLMHFDIGGRRGRIERYSRESIGAVLPPAAGTPRAANIEPPGVVAQTKGGFYPEEDPSKWAQGRATTFGYNDPEDNGIGSEYVGGLSTNNQYVKGIAIPEQVLRNRYGNNYANWRKARVDVVDMATGKRVRVPIVDIGPGSEQLASGVTADFTQGLNDYLGNTGEGKYAFNLVDNAGPDNKSHPKEFWDEQAAIHAGIDTGSKGRKPTDPTEHFMTWNAVPQDEVATAQGQQQQSEGAALDELAKNNPNPSGLYKRLNEKVEGVSDKTRQSYQAELKQKITADAQDYYGEKDPDKAFKTATSDADFGTVVGEIGSKIIPYWQKAAIALGQTADTADTNRIDQFIKMIEPKAAPENLAEFKRNLLALPIEQRTQYVAALMKHLEDEKGVEVSSAIDHPALLDAIDREGDPKAKAERQIKLDAAVAENLKNLRTDPRLINTPAGFVTEQLAQLPKNISEALIPIIGQNMMLSEIYTDTYAALKAENPKASDEELKQKASASTLAQLGPQEVMMALTGGAMKGLTGGIANRGARIIASMGTHAAVGAPVGAIGKGVQNIVEGKPVTEGMPQAAIAGAIQGAPGGIIGGLHGKPRAEVAPVVPEVAPERPLGAHGPPEPPVYPVSPAHVLGPDVPDTSMPWYKPGALVTRGEERTTFSPQELANRTEELRQQGWTPSQIQQVMENLQPAPDFNRRTVHLSEEAQISKEPPARLSYAQRAVAGDLIRQQGMSAQEAYDRVQRSTSSNYRDILKDAQIPLETKRAEPMPFHSARAVGESDPWVSRVANRLTAERIVKGEIGAVEPGIGVTKEEMLARGLKMKPEEVNQHVSDVMNNRKGNPKDQASALRAEEARLSQRSREASFVSEANPQNRQARLEAENAFKDLTDFHNGPMAKLKNDWHAQGMSLQGEIPVDLSTYNGLRDAYLREVGKPVPANMESTLRATAKRVRESSVAEGVALKKLGAEIERQSANRKLPTAEEVRMNIMKRMGVEPCPS